MKDIKSHPIIISKRKHKTLLYSSLLFVFPFCLAVKFNMQALASAIGLVIATSVANHSRISALQPWAKHIDRAVVQVISVTLTVSAFTMAPQLLYLAGGSCGIAAGIIYKFKRHKWDHVLMHFVGAVGFSICCLAKSCDYS